MEILVKKTREVGTSAGVLLPRKWLNKQVVVTLSVISKIDIAKDVFEILLDNNLNKEVKGIYLFGSYARNEESINSDIDILVLTDSISKILEKNNYKINLVSEKVFSKSIENNLFYQSILRELDIILNKELIKKYSEKEHSSKFKKNLSEIEKILNINKEAVETCEKAKKSIPDGIIYSLVLRLRELYLIKCIHNKNTYSKKKFIKFIGENNNSSYERVKREEKELNNISYKEAKNLLSLSEKWLRELKN